ncbi:hypothetical protein BC835DRAFT_1415509 [Cytidiella melzeri]|nr:hypothetical protein BC835DRAFT_1415509 [Cytidiella melzeri]
MEVRLTKHHPPKRSRQYRKAHERGSILRESPTAFEHIQDSNILKVGEAFGPFKDKEEWDLAAWMLKNIGHTAGDEFLKLPIIQNKLQSSFKNYGHVLQAVDQLPTGASWTYRSVTVTGDEPGADGETLSEELEMWFRDPMKCIRELLGNPLFRDKMIFAPEKLSEDVDGKEDVQNEMNMGDWWWQTQLKLPIGATVVPVILLSRSDCCYADNPKEGVK